MGLGNWISPLTYRFFCVIHRKQQRISKYSTTTDDRFSRSAQSIEQLLKVTVHNTKPEGVVAHDVRNLARIHCIHQAFITLGDAPHNCVHVGSKHRLECQRELVRSPRLVFPFRCAIHVVFSFALRNELRAAIESHFSYTGFRS